MVQTSIGNTLAFGIPGEHGNGQPWFADSALAGEVIEFGAPVVLDTTNGTVKAAGSSATTCDGILVSPHQHVRMELPSETASLNCAVGDTVAVARKGSWFIRIEGLDSAPTGIVKGVTSVAVASGKWAIAGEDDTPYATILDYGEAYSYKVNSATKYGIGLLVRII